MVRVLSNTKLQLVLAMLDAGDHHDVIWAKTGVSVGKISKIHNIHHPNLPKAKGGHPRKLDATARRRAVHLVTAGSAQTTKAATQELENTLGTNISTRTVQRALVEEGKASTLDCGGLDEGMEKPWGETHKLTSEGDCGSWETPSPFGGELYVEFLEDELMASLEYYGKEVDDLIFMHDNASSHMAGLVRNWLADKGIEVLELPAHSPDLNPIEDLWAHLKRELGKYPHPPKGVLELWERVETEWNKIDAKVCQELIESMPRRIQAVLKAKGGVGLITESHVYCFCHVRGQNPSNDSEFS
ncbi:hypothetical protein OPQ81_011223 [Rhizoctonia solani]|nr:hypothetical protein OPQ81_011223 [Rhizoctonia solani]